LTSPPRKKLQKQLSLVVASFALLKLGRWKGIEKCLEPWVINKIKYPQISVRFLQFKTTFLPKKTHRIGELIILLHLGSFDTD
jgi:hypothetical protein